MFEIKKILTSLLLITILTTVAFLPSINNDFTNFDDPAYVTQNDSIKSLSVNNLKSFFSGISLKKPGYMPLTLTSFAFEHHFFGLNPKIFHLNNLILHLFNTILAFIFIFLLFKKLDIALIASILFGVHPMHVESVAWISERKDVLYAFFYFSSLISYILYCSGEKLRKRYFVISFLLFLLAVFSKVMAVTLPVILLYIDFCLKRKFCSRIIFEKIPFFVISLSFGFFQLAQGLAGKWQMNMVDFFLEKILLSAYAFNTYIYKLFFPFNLSCFYPYPQKINNSFSLEIYIAPLISFFVIYLIVKLGKTSKEILFGFLFYISTIFIVLIVPSIKFVVADRFTYVPFLGLFIIIGQGYNVLINKKPQLKYAAIVFLICVVSFFSFLTFQRCGVWKNSLTLWNDVLAKYPNLSIAYNNRGNYFVKEKQYNLAIDDFTASLRIDPTRARIYANRGGVYANLKKYDLALKDYNSGLALEENYFILNNRGNLYKAAGKYSLAIKDYTQALKMNPMLAKTYVNRGIVFYILKQYDLALKDFTSALRINSRFAKVYSYRSVVYKSSGAYQKALEDALHAKSLGYSIDQNYIRNLEARFK